MARTTRSTVQSQDQDKLPNNSRTKAALKKRKRTSIGDVDEEQHTKQSRTESAPVNGDHSHNLTLNSDGNVQHDSKFPSLPNTGDVPITSDDATKILDILEMIDTQGLLDRVFPLPPTASSHAKSKESANSPCYSLRALLKDATQHPLHILRTAVQNFLPISYHSRSRPSTPAAQQLRFCNLALSLLQQASFHSVLVPLDVNFIPHTGLADEGVDGAAQVDDTKPSGAMTIASQSLPPRKRRYALLQRLPTGDWWTSLNSEPVPPSGPLNELPTGYAELVAILPTPSSSFDHDRKDIPTLGSYTPKKSQESKAKLPASRQVSCGSFLDYGPYASFAPTYDQEGREVGRAQLGEVYLAQRLRKRHRELAIRHSKSSISVDVQSDVMVVDESKEAHLESKTVAKEYSSTIDSLGGLLSENQITTIKDALGALDLEAALEELLERTCRALRRLETLQAKRLAAQDGGMNAVDVESEEWKTAQGIMDSLAVLASLRPRSSRDASPPLIPPPYVLHKLHRTLLLAPSAGWYGTLSQSRKTSLRDDTTIRVKTNAVPATTVNTTAPPATSGTPPAAPAPAHPFPAYAYAPYAAQQYRGSYLPYKPGQPISFYGTYAPSTPGQPASAQAISAGYYSSQFPTAGQQSYAYGGWYNYQPPTGTATASSSGRGTPQPVATTTPTPYAGLSTLQATLPQAQQTPQRAVANTVSTKQFSTSPWPVATSTPGYALPTVPAHLRSSAAPATPTPASPA